MAITWKYVKPLKDENAIGEACRQCGINAPAHLLACMGAHNGGRPSDKTFATTQSDGYVFNSLYSYNTEDANSVAGVFKSFVGVHLLPVGIEASGNVICYNTVKKRLVLFNHETGKTEDILVDSNPGLFSELGVV